jgi:hypothetical protein
MTVRSRPTARLHAATWAVVAAVSLRHVTASCISEMVAVVCAASIGPAA